MPDSPVFDLIQETETQLQDLEAMILDSQYDKSYYEQIEKIFKNVRDIYVCLFELKCKAEMNNPKGGQE